MEHASLRKTVCVFCMFCAAAVIAGSDGSSRSSAPIPKSHPTEEVTL